MKKRVNVAPSSDEGHFVENAKNVVNLDEVNETFLVEGESLLTTKNHTSLKTGEDTVITCQNVLNPFSGLYEKVRD